jgi:hypothetical protein
VILSERGETWVSRWRCPTRQKVAAAVANRLLHPAELPKKQQPTRCPDCGGCSANWPTESR